MPALVYLPRSRLATLISRISRLLREKLANFEFSVASPSAVPYAAPSMEQVTKQLRAFLQYFALQMIQHPEQAQLKVAKLGENRLRFKLILEPSDVALLIGRNGFTASAIRNVMKCAAERANVQVSLHIHSQAEEEEILQREA